MRRCTCFEPGQRYENCSEHPKMKYYHNAKDSFEPQITSNEDNVYYSEEIWSGPFETFEEAKVDALKQVRESIDNLKYQFNNIKRISKRDVLK